MNIAPKITTTGARLIAAERQRQISQEGWTPEHDDEHQRHELIVAAMAYANGSLFESAGSVPPDYWPWDEVSWKPSDDPIRNLTKAGALIAAEIDRLQRKEQS